MFLGILVWFLGVCSNIILLLPVFEPRHRALEFPATEWNRSIRIYRLNYTLFNLFLLASYIGLTVAVRLPTSCSTTECDGNSMTSIQSHLITFFGSIGVGAFSASSGFMLLSGHLKPQRFSGNMAVGLMWLIMLSLSVLLLIYQMLLLHYPIPGLRVPDNILVSWTYSGCIGASYLLFVGGAWMTVYRWKSRLRRTVFVVNGAAVKQVQLLKWRLFICAAVIYSLALLPYGLHVLQSLYEGEHWLMFSWQNSVTLTSSVAASITLSLPISVFYYHQNRQLLVIDLFSKAASVQYQKVAEKVQRNHSKGGAPSTPPRVFLKDTQIYESVGVETDA